MLGVGHSFEYSLCDLAMSTTAAVLYQGFWTAEDLLQWTSTGATRTCWRITLAPDLRIYWNLLLDVPDIFFSNILSHLVHAPCSSSTLYSGLDNICPLYYMNQKLYSLHYGLISKCTTQTFIKIFVSFDSFDCELNFVEYHMWIKPLCFSFRLNLSKASHCSIFLPLKSTSSSSSSSSLSSKKLVRSSSSSAAQSRRWVPLCPFYLVLKHPEGRGSPLPHSFFGDCLFSKRLLTGV